MLHIIRNIFGHVCVMRVVWGIIREWEIRKTVVVFGNISGKRIQINHILFLPFTEHILNLKLDYLFATQSQLLTTLKKEPLENIIGKGQNADTIGPSFNNPEEREF